MSDRKTIGVVLDWPDATSNYQKLLLNGIRRFAAERDANLLAVAVGRFETPFLWERGREFLYDYLSPEIADGLLLYTAALANFSGTEALEKRLRPLRSLPMVSIGAELSGTPSVLVDNRAGLRELVAHLIRDHGYSHLAFVGGPAHNEEAVLRRDTFLETAKSHGVEIPESHLYDGNFLISSGKEAVEELLDVREIRPQAIVCANDNMAIGVWQELWARRHVVPVDMAVTGYDDLEVSSLLELPFTTVRQPLFEQGYLAAEMLFDLLESRSSRQEMDNRTLPTEMVYRGSCGCPSHYETPPQSLSGEEEQLRGEWSALFEREKRAIRDAFELFRNGRGGDPLVRTWNAILLRAIEANVKQRETSLLFQEIREELLSVELSWKLREELHEKLEKMSAMIIDFYIQADLLGRLTSQGSLQNTMFTMDDFEQSTITDVALDQGLDRLEDILEQTGIETCFLSRFDEGSADPDGTSTLLFSYIDGERRKIDSGHKRFINRNIFHPEHKPDGRYELIVEALYEGNEQIGTVCFSMGASGNDTYEMLRRRLSGVIRTVNTTEHLINLNRQLEGEIEVRKRMEKQLKEALEEVQSLSLTDELTGLYNRRGFITLAEQQLRYCLREGEPFVIIYLDLNNLKYINDTYGHQEGDEIIRTVAEVLRRTFREVDIIGRLGGDEFTVFAGKVDAAHISTLRERLNGVLSEANEELDKEYDLKVSMGYYAHSEEGPDTLSEMLEVADSDMYREKRRNRGGTSRDQESK